MLIGIDGNEANQEKRVGVGEYGFQLLMQLKAQSSRLKAQNDNLKFKIYLKDATMKNLPPETDWWQYRVVGPKSLWTQIGLPIALFKDRSYPDVFFTPTHYTPRFCPCPRVIAVMDLSYLYFPEMFKKTDLWKLKNWTAFSIKKAKKILTISNSTRDDIIKYYQVEPKKVVVIYPGIRRLKSKMSNLGLKSQILNLRRKYKIEADYILYVGTLQPRKNLVRLIEAFKKLKTRFSTPRFQGRKLASQSGAKSLATHGKTTTQNLKLVIAGKKGWMYEEIFKKVKQLGLEKEVVFTGFVSEEDLPLLYKGAQCFVLVSLYEGFGLPALEAISLGVPVVVSNVSSLPEVVGQAGVLVDPLNIGDIARGIEMVLKFSDQERQQMIEKGKKQAQKFSWERCAKETLNVLMEAATLKPKF